MGQTKKVTEADRIAFRAHLINYLNMQADTRRASIALAKAQEEERRLYAAESKQREAVIHIWDKLREHEWLTFQHFQLPDGRIVKVERGNIHVVDTAQI